MADCHFPSYCCWSLLPSKPFSRSQCLSFAKCFTSMILPFSQSCEESSVHPHFTDGKNEVKKGVEPKLEEELLSWLCHASPFQITQAVLGSCLPPHPQDLPFSSSWSHLLSFLVPSPLPHWLSFQPLCLGLSEMTEGFLKWQPEA